MKADLGTMLVEAGKITEEQYADALSFQKSGQGKFEDGLVSCGAVESVGAFSWPRCSPKQKHLRPPR